MSVSSFFEQYDAGGFDGFQSSTDAYNDPVLDEYGRPVKYGGLARMNERQGTQAFASFLQGEFESGALSDASVNPAITGYLNSIGQNERRRQDELLQYLANSGMSESSARALIAEDDVRGDRELSSALAGFQDQLQDERYRAKAGLVSFANQENIAEKTAAQNTYWKIKSRDDYQKDRKNAMKLALIGPYAGQGLQGGAQYAQQQSEHSNNMELVNALKDNPNNRPPQQQQSNWSPFQYNNTQNQQFTGGSYGGGGGGGGGNNAAAGLLQSLFAF